MVHLAKSPGRADASTGRGSRIGRLEARATATRLALLAGLVSLGLGCFELSLPHVLGGISGWDEGYDEGVYVGAAIHFVHGVLPYRDFVLVHPPGILLLLAPFALLGDAFGSQFTLEAARCLTVVVIAANAVLAGLIVRPLGKVATATAAFALGLWPLTVAEHRSVELEPYLVLFCLVAFLVLFDGGQLASRRRVAVAGLLLGLAFSVKVWAVLPIVAVGIVTGPRWRTRGVPLAAGVTAGVVLPCVVFFVAAPHAFVHDVIVDQLSRNGRGGGSVPLQNRLLMLTGLGRLPLIGPRIGVGVGVCAAFAGVVVAVFVAQRRRLLLMEWAVLVTALVVFGGMFASAASYEFYLYFPAAFFAMLLGVCAGRVSGALRSWRRPAPAHGRSGIGLVGVGILALAVVGFLLEQEIVYGQDYLLLVSDPGPALAATIPAGSCVISDNTAALLVADRFTPSGAGCPAEVDPFGSYLAEDGGRTPYLAPSYPIPFEAQWLSALQRTDFVILQVPFSDYFPWAPFTMRWFSANYRLAAHFSEPYPPVPEIIARIVPSATIDENGFSEYVYQNVSGIGG